MSEPIPAANPVRPRERLLAALLDVRGRLIRAAQVAEGSLSQCPISPRDALRPAVREGAHSIVLCHNHPGGVLARSGSCAARRARPRGRQIGPATSPHNPPRREARP